MSEQYPLLNEELSDEDKFSPRFQRRRPMNLKGRATYHMKGAAAIMTRWPEHWTSILTYWWMGLGMIALTTFIIYNTIFSIALLQPTNTMPAKYAKIGTHTTKTTAPPGVFMHVFANDQKDQDLNKYIPYIEVFANKYKGFTYHLIIVTNDTNIEANNVSDKVYNDIALNSLWDNNVNYGNVIPTKTNINVKYVNLSKYLNESPLKKYWKDLPYQFIQFLVRAVSVWEKGGIAINPDILTPLSPHAAYIEKFVSIIKNFEINRPSTTFEQKHEVPNKKHTKTSPRFNNIQDIINALEVEEGRPDSDKEILHAAESQNNVKKSEIVIIPRTNEDQEKGTNALKEQFDDPKIALSSVEAFLVPHESSNTKEDKSDSSNFLPSFMDYLFNRKTKSYKDVTHSLKKRSSIHNDAADTVENSDLHMRNFWNDIVKTDNYKPMIVSAKGILNNTATNKTTNTYKENEKIFDLTVDLKGNIVATETPCHAFIGNVFTNAIHHDASESLTDFIIKELSIFCKGLLASCMGIDVILV